MPTTEVTINELFILEVLRNFDFLRLGDLGYKIDYISVAWPEPSVGYKSSKFKRKISIVMIDPNLISIDIRNFSFSLKKNYININQLMKNKYPQVEIPEIVNEKNIGEVLAKYSKFIQENLSSLVEGKAWN